MSRNVLRDRDVAVNPSTRTVTLAKNVEATDVMLITNVTKNIVIYNFSDPALGFTSFTNTSTGASTTATMVLKYNTSLMSAQDQYQVIVEHDAETVGFEDEALDGVQKLRVASPQSLMDTDFEYSVQPSKWEALYQTANYPSFFAKSASGGSLPVSSIIGDGRTPRSTMTVTTETPHGLVSGNVVSVQDTNSALVEGTSLVLSAPTANTFTFTARGVVGGEQAFPNLTSAYGGDLFENAHIPGGQNTSALAAYGGTNTLVPFSATVDGAAPTSNVTVTFTNPHGLYPGTQLVITGTNSFDGTYIISKVPTPNSAIFNIGVQRAAITVPSTSQIIAKSDGYIIHRPADGGVSLTTYNNVPGAQTIRQTRRYFRYQSGKSIQFSTGAKFTPTFDVTSISLNGGAVGPAFVTVRTIQDHCLQIGAVVYIEGVETSRGAYNPFNGEFPVTEILDANTFRYAVTLTSTVAPVDLNPGGINVFAHAEKWEGACTRAGMFDEQNGFYFEFDGKEMAVARRFSYKEIFGRVSATKDSNVITGTTSQFRKQLIVGQNIVIKGTSYKVIQINSDTSMNVAPAYRGQTQSGLRALITQNIRVPQSQWNLDKMDGTGPSKYKFDVRKMQMVYIDYTWYGAGYVRFGMRGIDGRIVYFHKMPNNNINNSAYQRSGNLPARYEVTNEPVNMTRMIAGESGSLGSALNPTATTMWVEDAARWASTGGYLIVRDANNVEIMYYTSVGAFDPAKGGYPVTVQRRKTVTVSFPELPFTYGATDSLVTFTPDSSIAGTGGGSQVSVQTISQTCAPIISHWGSSVIMDGRFDNDQNYVFTAGMNKYLSIQPGTTRPLVAIRIAPSVDNAIARNFGIRELINRMQLQLVSTAVQTNGSFRIDGILNPAQLLYTNWTPAQLTRSSNQLTGTSGQNTMTIAVADTAGLTGITPGTVVASSSHAVGTTVVSVAGNLVTLSQANTANVVAGTTAVTFTPRTGYTGLPNDWTRDAVGSGSLAQVLYFDNTGSGPGNAQTASGFIYGGDSVFSFYSENGSATSYNATSQSLGTVRDLGTSILSGNGNVTSPSYPNGPDILVLTATNIGTSAANIGARISWTEAQA